MALYLAWYQSDKGHSFEASLGILFARTLQQVASSESLYLKLQESAGIEPN
jgi:hypothetical protein